MKKYLKKMLAIMTAFMICLGIVNVQPVHAAQQKKSVFSIDAGRKYFSEAQLKEIINKAYLDGYSDVQLILGNDGFRFLLDDMTITSSNITYKSEDVKEAIKNGNKKYYDDPNGNVLTEEEMDNIVAYAKERDMDLIPVFNSPGHMDALLSAMIDLGMTDAAYTRQDTGNTSERTIDLSNEVAKSFVSEVVKKYVKYFAQTGVVEIFNFGADEYAGDVFDMMSGESPWEKLVEYHLYDQFIDYINGLSKIIKEEGLTPMCFNDGIYACYEKAGIDYQGVIDTDIIVSVWIYMGGTGASPDYLAQKGFKIMNTNFNWYWVLGMKTADEYPAYYLDWALNGIKNNEFTSVSGASDSVDPIGSTQAIWCDVPSKAYDQETIFKLMDAFSSQYSEYMVRPADYSKVDEALSKVPTDLSKYTDETVNRLNNAINSVVRNKRVTEQEIVDSYAQAINDAIQGLKEKTVEVSKDDTLQKTEDKKVTNKKESSPKTGDDTNFGMLFLLIASLFIGIKVRKVEC